MHALSRPWPSADQRQVLRFDVRPVVRSRNPAERRANTDFVRRELAQGRPLLMGADDHAMVLVSLDCERVLDARGAEVALRVVGGLAADPWLRGPGAPDAADTLAARGLRALQPHELRPTMLIGLGPIRAVGNDAPDPTAAR